MNKSLWFDFPDSEALKIKLLKKQNDEKQVP